MSRLLKKTKKAGFTLIELLVVLGIFAVIMSVALFNQSSLTSSVLITNLAYETALAVREAQTYGISVKATASTSDYLFDRGYGVYFNKNNSNQIVVFADSNGDNKYNVGATPTELQSLYEIKNQRGNKISAICVGKVGQVYTPPCKTSNVEGLNIMFKRPNPESNFFELDASGNVVASSTGPAVIVVKDAQNSNCRAIVVEVTGQIRVENSSSPNSNCTNTP